MSYRVLGSGDIWGWSDMSYRVLEREYLGVA